jgi:toxin ParE1/3/4
VTFQISKRASDDLDAIWDYIARDNPDAADRLEQKLHDAMTLLSRMPRAGRTREDLPGGVYRSFPVDSYLIIHLLKGRKVIVVRVLHGARSETHIQKKAVDVGFLGETTYAIATVTPAHITPPPHKPPS